jgi:hypothetical protein
MEMGCYSWEPWHFGFVAGPPPCSQLGNDGGVAPGGGWELEGGPSQGLPSFVPVRFRDPLLRSAARWNVSAAPLAAQLMAESGFDPYAVSPAGAQGIAQFMPGTAASYGLHDPFDPEAAIDAQAQMMSGLLRHFGSVRLALAAYNGAPPQSMIATACPPFPRRSPTWPASSPCSTAPGRCSRRRSRCDWSLPGLTYGCRSPSTQHAPSDEKSSHTTAPGFLALRRWRSRDARCRVKAAAERSHER